MGRELSWLVKDHGVEQLHEERRCCIMCNPPCAMLHHLHKTRRLTLDLLITDSMLKTELGFTLIIILFFTLCVQSPLHTEALRGEGRLCVPKSQKYTHTTPRYWTKTHMDTDTHIYRTWTHTQNTFSPQLQHIITHVECTFTCAPVQSKKKKHQDMTLY